jgi:hypothetical protein
LATVGWTGTWWGSGFLDDTVLPLATVSLHVLPMGNFQLIAVYEKKHEVDDGTGKKGTRAANKYDQDWDEWSITPVYKFANGGVACTFAYNKINSQFYKLEAQSCYAAVAGSGAAATAGLGGTSDIDAYYWAINPGVAMDFGPVGIHVEAAYASGKAQWNNPTGTPATWTPGESPMTSKTKST